MCDYKIETGMHKVYTNRDILWSVHNFQYTLYINSYHTKCIKEEVAIKIYAKCIEIKNRDPYVIFSTPCI